MTARNPTTTSTRPAITPLARARSARRPSRARRPNNDTAAKQAHTAAPSRCTTWPPGAASPVRERSEEHTSELQSRGHLVCRLLLEKKNTIDMKQNKQII